MSISYWLDDSKDIKEITDIVVIGGGIAGLSTAYWLLKEDLNINVSIIEKDRIGFGASGRNAGFITCGSVEHFNRLVEKHGKDEAAQIWKFSEENLKLLREEIIKEDGEEVYFEEKGSFSLASTDHEFKELQKSSDIMRDFGIKTQMLLGPDIESRLNTKGFVGGIKYCDDASVHPVKLLNLIKKRCGSRLKIFEGQEVYNIHNQENGSKVIQTDKQTFECSVAVLATNAFSPLLHDYFKDKIFPTKGQILITEPINEHFMEGPCYANFVLDYFRQLPTGEVLIGGFRQLEKETEVGYSDHTTDKIQNALEDFLDHHIPKIKGKKITHRWSGVMGFSVDGQPMVGSIPSDPQLFFVGGFTCHGIGLSFHSAKCVVDLIYGRNIPDFINARRFN